MRKSPRLAQWARGRGAEVRLPVGHLPIPPVAEEGCLRSSPGFRWAVTTAVPPAGNPDTSSASQRMTRPENFPRCLWRRLTVAGSLGAGDSATTLEKQ